MTIVATDATVRSQIIKELLLHMGELCVACNRFFLKLKTSLNSSEQINIRVEGVNWGLASNSIHFLDLFSFFHRMPGF